MEDDLCSVVEALVGSADLASDIALDICEALKRGSGKGVYVGLPDLSSDRTGAVALRRGAGILAAGGHSKARHRLQSVEYLGDDAECWTAAPPLCVPRFLACGVSTVGNGALVFGGDTGETYLATVEGLLPDGESWAHVCDMPCPRRGAGAAVPPASPGAVFVIGGHTGVDDVSTVDVFDAGDGGRWLPAPPLPAKRFCPAVACLDSAVYCCGGFDGDFGTKTVFRLDPREHGAGWVAAAPMRSFRFGAAVAAYGGGLRVVGGQNGQAFTATAEAYCPVANRWTSGTSLPAATSGCAACPFRDFVAIVGGSSQTAPGESESTSSRCTLMI
ncbi:Kelch-like protein diablo [Diplonema papillatum]|nr:Kelch-like protein diablo [Diplonema papillatum]